MRERRRRDRRTIGGRGVITRVLAALCAALAPLLADIAPARAEFATRARQAIVTDFETGTTLFEKAANERIPPASLAKMMTAYVVFGFLRDGRVSLDDELPVSRKAWRMGGSKMFVPVGKRVRVEDLVRGMIVQSGNDACIVLAEGLAGSEESFVALMNKEARRIGLRGSRFVNVTGWPDPAEYATARDLATVARHLIADFPDDYRFYSEREFVYGGIKQGNRNPLLYRGVGADGLKTGYTEEAGYALAASAVRDGRRLVAVTAGLPSAKARAQETARLIEWAFREFRPYRLFEAGETVAEADVWLGAEDTVPLTIERGATVVLSRAARRGMTATLVYDAPLEAPVAKGERVAKLVVKAPGAAAAEFPVLAGADVGELSGVPRALATAGEMLKDWTDDLFPMPRGAP